jgi:acetyltransferase-like isoleucine patch superfamily enzyme
MVDKGIHLRNPPSRHWRIGKQVYFARNVILDIAMDGSFAVGDRTKIMHYVVIGVHQKIAIGSDCQIAEASTVRDSNHGIDEHELITLAPITSSPVILGDDVWVGRGVAVLAGSHIGDGAVVGANSVVNGQIPPYSVAVGSPARVNRMRGRHQ